MRSFKNIPKQNESDLIKKIKKDIKAAFSKLVMIERHTSLQEEYFLLNQELQLIKSNFLNLPENEPYESLSNKIETLILKIHDTFSPYQVSITSKLYNQTINRICYRGDDRQPTTENGEGVFQLGFTKQKMTKKYQKWVEQFYYDQSMTNDLRVIHPFTINRATTNPTSRDPKSAAFFPIVFKLTKLAQKDIFVALQKKLNELNIFIDVQESYINQLENIDDPNTLLTLQNENYSESQKKILITILKNHFGENSYKVIDKLLLKIENKLIAQLGIKDNSWIYVVFIGKGFDVSSHGYTHTSLNKTFINPHYTFFAQEICADEIKPKHVIAAVKISRDFTNLRYHRESMQQSGRFYGEANFTVNEIIYNENALNHFKQYDIDINFYKELLNQYFSKEKTLNINLSDDGHVKRIINK